MPNKNYSRNAEEKLEVVKYAERHGNAATAKHYDIGANKSSFDSNANQKTKNQFSTVSR